MNLRILKKINIEVGFGECIFFLYLLVLIRQFSWIIPNNMIAWIATVIITVLVWYIYCSINPLKCTNSLRSIAFWLIIVCPIFLFFILRLPFVDISYDVLNYHLMSSIKSLNGTLFDFKFPIYILNTLPDMIIGLFRLLLGYRLATIINVFVLLWLAIELDNYLKSIITNEIVRYVAILVAIMGTENILFLINSGLTDLYFLPLVVRAIFILQILPKNHKIVHLLFPYSSFLLGMALALKYTNITAIIPIIFVGVYIIIKNRIRIAPVTLLLSLIFFCLPLVPFTFWIAYKTHNPVFPFFNNIFHSPYWSLSYYTSTILGPANLKEALIWPVLTVFEPGRISEIYVYSGRLAIGFILSILLLIYKKVDEDIKILSFIVFAGAVLWSFSTGIIRYALFFEIITGILMIYIIFYLFKFKRSSIPGICILIVLTCICQFQLIWSLNNSLQTEWSLRPTFFDNKGDYISESRFILGDRDLETFITNDEKHAIDQVDVWAVVDPLTSGIEAILKPRIPINNFNPDLTTTESQLEFKRMLNSYNNKKIYTIVYQQNLPEDIKVINSLNMSIAKEYSFPIPFYSYYTILDCVLLEIAPNSQNQNPLLTALSGPLPDNAYKANITSTIAYTKFGTGKTKTFILRVQNQSGVRWPALGAESGLYKIQLGDHWYNTNGQLLIKNDGGSGLPFDLDPGQEIELPLNVTAPSQPGNYILGFDMVQEGVSWFNAKGSQELKMMVSVE